MVSVPEFDPGENKTRRHLVMALALVVALAVLIFAWRELTAPVTRKVKNDQSVFAIQPDLPPPPPPPPPPPQAPEKPPEPSTQQRAAAPVPQAAPAAPAQQVQMDAAPSAGAGGIAAGGGSGMGAPGSCINNCGTGGGGGDAAPINTGFYLRTLSSELQTIIDRDRKLNRLVFDARLHITVSAAGVVTAVDLVGPSGKNEIDSRLTELLRSAHDLSLPPAGMHFPLIVKVRGRKAFS